MTKGVSLLRFSIDDPRIYCEGHCQVSDRVRRPTAVALVLKRCRGSLLSWGEADNSMEIGKKVGTMRIDAETLESQWKSMQINEKQWKNNRKS